MIAFVGRFVQIWGICDLRLRVIMLISISISPSSSSQSVTAKPPWQWPKIANAVCLATASAAEHQRRLQETARSSNSQTCTLRLPHVCFQFGLLILRCSRFCYANYDRLRYGVFGERLHTYLCLCVFVAQRKGHLNPVERKAIFCARNLSMICVGVHKIKATTKRWKIYNNKNSCVVN